LATQGMGGVRNLVFEYTGGCKSRVKNKFYHRLISELS